MKLEDLKKLSKKELKTYYKNNDKIKCLICGKELRLMSLSRHIKARHNLLIKDYYDNFLKEDGEGICVRCGEKTNFYKMNNGYSKFCSNNCCAKYQLDKIKETNLKKYGVENVFQVDIYKDKIKETNLKKYGNECARKNDIINNKIKETNLKKYGYISPASNKKVKMKNSNIQLNRTFNKIKRLYEENDIELLFDRNNYNGCFIENNKWIKYPFKCVKCGYEFKRQISYNYNCPKCSPKSKYEFEIEEFLNNLNISHIKNTKEIITPFELDFYISTKNLAIEFNGIHWHSELMGKDRNYHLNKTNLCLDKSVTLLHIFENEWIEKQNIWKSIIKSKLNMYDTTIYARKCEIREVENKEKNEFLDNSHLQGQDKSSYKYGLYYENEFVSLLTICKPRYNKNYDWEISRFCNKLNCKVIGGFSKLLKHARKHLNGSIITYSDLRYSQGDLYRNNGFFELKNSNPNYFYIVENSLKSRIQFQKHKLNEQLEYFDEELSEWENMMMNGYDRIWDCGNKVFHLL